MRRAREQQGSAAQDLRICVQIYGCGEQKDTRDQTEPECVIWL